MRIELPSRGWKLALWLWAAALTLGVVDAQTTAFTYQGRLLQSGGAAPNGLYDFRFSVCDALSGGASLAGPLTYSATPLTNGLFTVALDFGAAPFNGASRWLEIAVRTNGAGAFTTLSPRQALLPTPYALEAGAAATAAIALSATTVTGPVAAGQITGTLAATNIGAGTVGAADLAPNAAAANLAASGLGGVASGGLVLSSSANNTNLANAGYVKIYGTFSTPDAWQLYTNAVTTPPPIPRTGHTAVWTGTEMIIWGGYDGGYLNDGGRYNPTLNSWTPLPVVAGATPAPRLNHTAVWTGSAMLVWGGAGGTNLFNDGGLYDPAQNLWTSVGGGVLNAPKARLFHTAVWTGNAMIVWGGSGAGGLLNDGGVYNPGLNRWTPLAAGAPDAPSGRVGHTAVWSGTELIVWGGSDAGGTLADGGRYNPAAQTWTSLPAALANNPGARQAHTAVWTGTAMAVWGGADAAGDLNDGGFYDPAANAWTSLPGALANTPCAREAHCAVWTGAEMLVWGGFSDTADTLVNDGGRYDPATGAWTPVPAALASVPSARYQAAAVWTGGEMIVWGGVGLDGNLGDGGRYNPAQNTWVGVPAAAASAPVARTGQTGIWTGSELIVWGGVSASSYLADGGRFNPALNAWTYLSATATNVPTPRQAHTAVWTGTEMLVWGGVNSGGFLGDGGRYSPTQNRWLPVPAGAANEPAGREFHSALWTGGKLLVWGGLGTAGCLGDGGLFDPVAGTWSAVPATLANSPAPRASHAAVWTGSQMIIWGGTSNAANYADGGLFDPAVGAWTALPATLANTPGARATPAAVWTGSQMIIWGGTTASGLAGDGGLYAPAANTWTSLPGTLANSPAARTGHSAVWTGSELIVWGGNGNAANFADGGRFDPAAISWTTLPASLANAPAARERASAVWTGTQMLLWGGVGAAAFNDTFGYTPGRTLYLYLRP